MPKRKNREMGENQEIGRIKKSNCEVEQSKAEQKII